MRLETVPNHASASPCQSRVIPRAVRRDSGERVHGLAHVSLSLSHTCERMYNPNRNQEVASVKAHKPTPNDRRLPPERPTRGEAREPPHE